MNLLFANVPKQYVKRICKILRLYAGKEIKISYRTTKELNFVADIFTNADDELMRELTAVIIGILMWEDYM